MGNKLFDTVAFSREARLDSDGGGDKTSGGSGGPSENSSNHARRTVLKGLAASAALGPAAFSGRGRAASPVPDRLADTFGNIVNVVDAGADPTGEESINDVLEEVRADDTLLYFPEGTYYMDRQFRFTDFENFGMYGDNTTLKPANYHDNADDKHKMFRLGTGYAPGQRVVVEHFTVDFREPDTGLRVFDIVAGTDMQVRNVSVVGEHDSGMWGPARFVMNDPDGRGEVFGFLAPDGGKWSENTVSAGRLWRGPTGIICNVGNKGHMIFRKCQLGSYPDNGLYAGDSQGPVTIIGGEYRNGNANIIRVGGPEATLKDVTIVADDPHELCEAYCAIRLQDTVDATIDGCDITIDVPVNDSMALKVMDGCSGHTLLENTRINMATDVYNNAVWVSPNAGSFVAHKVDVEQHSPGGSAFFIEGVGDDEEWARLVDVNITGNPGHRYNRAAIYNWRNDVTFRDVTVKQGGGDKRRALENFGDDCFMTGCDFDVVQFPVIDSGSGTWVSYSDFTSTDGLEGYLLTDDSSDVTLTGSHIDNGIRDWGCDGLDAYNNTY